MDEMPQVPRGRLQSHSVYRKNRRGATAASYQNESFKAN